MAGGAGRPSLGLGDAGGVLRIASGRLRPEGLSLFSLFRDEMFFAPAFLAHYRGLGVGQFVILDDGSVDGTREFLAAQPDCVLFESDLRYGDEIAYVDPAGRRTALRAGIYFKMAGPPAFLSGRWVLYVDADEFLLPPPGMSGIGDIVGRLEAAGAACCAASIVEFFPETVAGLRGGRAPASFGELIADYGFFQPEPMAEVDAAGVPRAVGRSKSARLFERHGVAIRQKGLRRRIEGLFAPEYRKSPQFKTPLFRCDAETYLTGTHLCSRPAPRGLLLTLAHFVFTAQFEAKVARALDWRSYVNGSDKYGHYARLLERIGRGDGRLADGASQLYVSAEQLIAAGLMRW
jgi:glycosyltransferase involved in cell wall biosynthesis